MKTILCDATGNRLWVCCLVAVCLLVMEYKISTVQVHNETWTRRAGNAWDAAGETAIGPTNNERTYRQNTEHTMSSCVCTYIHYVRMFDTESKEEPTHFNIWPGQNRTHWKLSTHYWSVFNNKYISVIYLFYHREMSQMCYSQTNLRNFLFTIEYIKQYKIQDWI